jgi:hypothetical protein
MTSDLKFYKTGFLCQVFFLICILNTCFLQIKEILVNFGNLLIVGVERENTGDGISYASHVKNPNPLKARATTFYDPVHNALDKEAQCAWKEGEGSHWPSVYIQKPFMTL